uniref:Uncharacterized protein n=1 Tax=Rhizophora mucronata TaxID=61149 RepID=A0A2P2NG73_RHIMU
MGKQYGNNDKYCMCGTMVIPEEKEQSKKIRFILQNNTSRSN